MRLFRLDGAYIERWLYVLFIWSISLCCGFPLTDTVIQRHGLGRKIPALPIFFSDPALKPRLILFKSAPAFITLAYRRLSNCFSAFLTSHQLYGNVDNVCMLCFFFFFRPNRINTDCKSIGNYFVNVA
ncbi:uncharacterized protein BYT42DRAFT_580415 [Radiomyces spectabilis]|uniref:uncharacterized protein n=1 Tax=Radiomyces spectabilis TaxID=64574 RepID=UPI0022208B82|nr:uncharacterized protein BYT42DRAFT_580415 [Radiomyces spectabilis]KAI8371482.1 hypothetical protein BYT42DRAFT_580415 [Radiomyces spectabilis]